TVQRDRVLVRHWIAALAFALRLLPWQAPYADHVRLERVLHVERPDHALVPARRVVRQERERALVIDAEAVRAGARRVVEADLLGLIGLADVEDEEAGACVAAAVAGKALGIDPQDVVADHAQLVAMHAGWRAEFKNLLGILRIAHVVRRESFGRVAARGADR